MRITKKPFGTLPSGEAADLYILENASGASVAITNYGGIVTEINVPDRDGKIENVVLGCATVSDYVPNNGYLGALIGRHGNRINRGRFELNGVQYQLAQNDNGHNLHGGDIGFDKKLWAASVDEGARSLVLKYTSPDGEENFPGRLDATVTYSFTDENELKIRYEAVSDADTICNLTNHSYFNLAGEASGSTILDHMISINADRVTIVDADSIPTGEMRDVSGTPFDLRSMKRIADGIALIGTDEQITFGKGYDHNFMINGEGMRKAGAVYCEQTGRVMDVYTDLPAMQLYTGNMLDGTMRGHSGRVYNQREALCLETQAPPDSMNHPNFPNCILRKGEKYDTTTIYRFSVK